MIEIATSIDLVVACDTSRSALERFTAWHRYEVRVWMAAHTQRGLFLRNIDGDRARPDGESIRQLVERELRLARTSGPELR